MNTWTLPKLSLPEAIKAPKSKRHKNSKGRAGMFLIEDNRKMMDIPSGSINTVKTLQRDKTDMIKRGGR
jgi:hypothetical protein